MDGKWVGPAGMWMARRALASQELASGELASRELATREHLAS